MPTQKDLKRRVRERMRKTGESYTAARARLIEKRPAKAAVRPAAVRSAATLVAPDLAEIAGMSDESVAKKTGRTWKEWVTVLDRAGAAAKPHREIALLLHETHGVPGWWSQMVTVGYERIRGLREKGQRRDGGFEVNKSKVYPVPLPELWKAFGRCKLWMGDVGLRMSKAAREKSMRMRWKDGTPVAAWFVAKGPAKSQVQVQHGKLATREEAARLRAFWTEKLAALGDYLARGAETKTARK